MATAGATGSAAPLVFCASKICNIRTTDGGGLTVMGFSSACRRISGHTLAAKWIAGETSIVFPVLCLFSVLLFILSSSVPVMTVFNRVSSDFGEGWNAYWAMAIQNAHPLYSTHRVFTANNYPPISFYINAALGSVVGDNIIAGRLIALASIFGVAALITRIILIQGAPLRWAFLSAVIFLVYNVVDLRPMFGINNPQWLGELVGLTGVLPLIRQKPKALTIKATAVAAIAMVIAGLIKHNLIALPLSITMWLFIYNRRACVVWLSLIALMSAIAIMALYFAYGISVFIEVLTYKRTLSYPEFWLGIYKTGSFSSLIIVALVSIPALKTHPRAMLLPFYAIAGIVIGVFQRLGSGVFINAHDDALIGLILTCGAFLGLLAKDDTEEKNSVNRRSFYLFIMLFPIIIITPKHIGKVVSEYQNIARQKATWAAMISDTRKLSNPVGCEILSVCYWASKPLEIDFFAYGQKLKTGTDASYLKDAIGSRSFKGLVIDQGPGIASSEKRLPPPFQRLIYNNYYVVRADINGVSLMLPKTH